MVMLSMMSLPMHLNHLVYMLFYDQWLIVVMPVIRRIGDLVLDIYLAQSSVDWVDF